MPQQENNHDCGVFMLTFIEHLSRGASFSFAQKNIGFLRKRMTWELLNGRFLTGAVVENSI